jgi:hypothetical protein
VSYLLPFVTRSLIAVVAVISMLWAAIVVIGLVWTIVILLYMDGLARFMGGTPRL